MEARLGFVPFDLTTESIGFVMLQRCFCKTRPRHAAPPGQVHGELVRRGESDQDALLFRSGRGIPRLAHAWHDGGKGVTGDGCSFDDAYRDIDCPGADARQVRGGNVRLETDGKTFVHVNVLKAAGTIFGNAEPCAVAECVAPGLEFIKARDEILANGVGYHASFVQDTIEFEGEAVLTADL